MQEVAGSSPASSTRGTPANTRVSAIPRITSLALPLGEKSSMTVVNVEGETELLATLP